MVAALYLIEPLLEGGLAAGQIGRKGAGGSGVVEEQGAGPGHVGQFEADVAWQRRRKCGLTQQAERHALVEDERGQFVEVAGLRRVDLHIAERDGGAGRSAVRGSVTSSIPLLMPAIGAWRSRGIRRG